MNFLSLEYFVVVAEELSMTKASQRLFVSQQSLSKHIINLEQSLEIKLFDRSPNLSLTYAGSRFLRTAIQILDLKRQIVMEMDDINNHVRGELRIGISHTRGRVILPKILPLFCKSHPFIDISIKEGNSKELEEYLLHGQIDLLIGFSPIVLDVAETINILKERLLLVVPNKLMVQKYAKDTKKMVDKFREGASIEDFLDFPFLMTNQGNRIRTLFNSYLNHKQMSINVILEMESIETLLSLSCEGMGITIYPEMFAKNLSPMLNDNSSSLIHFFPLDDASTIGNLLIAYHRERYLSEPMQDFIDDCHELKIELNAMSLYPDHHSL